MEPETFPRHGTLIDSRKWIAEKRAEGVNCPVCDRKVKEYSRPINRAQALAITAMYLAAKTDWVNVRDLKSNLQKGTADKNNEISKLAHWGLVQQHPDVRRGGWWRVTKKGALWVRGRIAVPRNAILYQAERTGMGTTKVYLKDLLAEGADANFDLRVVMADITKVARKKTTASSDPMFNEETLLRRTRRKVNAAGVPLNNVDDDADGLFASVTDSMERVEYSLNHELFFGDETVSQAREWLYKNLKRGVFCPTCDRIAVYKHYPMKDSMARLLIEMYRHHGTGAVDVREFYVDGELVDRNNYVAKIAQRNLVEEIPVRRGDGGKAGWYRLTDDGVNWIFNRSVTPATVSSYNYYTVKSEDGKKENKARKVSVIDVFRDSSKWSYRELMKGLVADPEHEEIFLVG